MRARTRAHARAAGWPPVARVRAHARTRARLTARVRARKGQDTQGRGRQHTVLRGGGVHGYGRVLRGNCAADEGEGHGDAVHLDAAGHLELLQRADGHPRRARQARVQRDQGGHGVRPVRGHAARGRVHAPEHQRARVDRRQRRVQGAQHHGRPHHAGAARTHGRGGGHRQRGISRARPSRVLRAPAARRAARARVHTVRGRGPKRRQPEHHRQRDGRGVALLRRRQYCGTASALARARVTAAAAALPPPPAQRRRGSETRTRSQSAPTSCRRRPANR